MSASASAYYGARVCVASARDERDPADREAWLEKARTFRALARRLRALRSAA